MTMCHPISQERRNNSSCLQLIHIQKTSSQTPQKPTLPPDPTTSINHQTSTLSPPSYQNMPVSYQAFREITNLIRNNGDDWEEFRTKTTHTTRKAERTSDPSTKPSKHKIAENKGLAPKPLLQENPHHFVLFPIHHNDSWWM